MDSDADGLSDALEQRLLEQFLPKFMVARGDCSGLPAEFVPDLEAPTVERENGTIYGQVFPLLHVVGAGADAGGPEVELHFYHLWRQDCGAHGHALDTEHVAVLVRASEANVSRATWRALYWYAGAHEQTVCDVSQIARASTLHAEDSGARIWISYGKHASYLDERLCEGGCGADRCEAMVPLRIARVINLGESGHPMNGSSFIVSSRWPLTFKMEHTNFPAGMIARLDRMPDNEIAWFVPGHHATQGIIAVSYVTASAIDGGAADTAASVGAAGDSTSDALSAAEDSTDSALGKSYRKTAHALGSSARHVGRALGLVEKRTPSREPEK